MTKRLTIVIQPEGSGFVALCPELDVVSQGDSIEEARNNLREALELFFKCASPAEARHRLRGDGALTDDALAEAAEGLFRAMDDAEAGNAIDRT